MNTTKTHSDTRVSASDHINASEILTGTRIAGTSRWIAFWSRGGWWKALLAAAVYLALYLGFSQIVGRVFSDQIGTEGLFASPPAVFFGLLLPVAFGSIVLLAFAASLRWLPQLFGRQPVGGRWWMWIAPVVVVTAAVLRAAGTDWSAYSAQVIVLTFVAGLFIGLSEELLTRGIAVNLLRRGGYSERVVMLLSSLLFALLHSANLLSGQPVGTVLATMGFTFLFGVAMYLTMRVTGSLIWPILLHAVTDPTTFLATGGLDSSVGQLSPLVTLAGLSVAAYAVLALVAVIFVRGRAVKAERGLA